MSEIIVLEMPVIMSKKWHTALIYLNILCNKYIKHSSIARVSRSLIKTIGVAVNVSGSTAYSLVRFCIFSV